MSDIAAWLKHLGLSQHIEAFIENDIGFDVLPELTEEHLKELGISLGHRVRLLKAIATLSSQQLQHASPTDAVAPVSPVTSSAERRQLTVMFIDLVDSTALSEHYDPEDLGSIIRAFQDCCAAIIGRYEGFIAHYMGDGILAYFGYPHAHEDDAERALRAGLELIAAVSELKPQSDLILQSRIGVATGLVVVGETLSGAGAQQESVVGETPNLAARLQALAKPDTLVIAASTRRLAGGGFEYTDLGQYALKGFSAPVQAWCVEHLHTSESRFAARTETLAPFIGREAERSLLLDRWQQAAAGEGQVVLLSGEPGIGKSRLTQALRESIADHPHLRLHYQCSPYHRNSALYPITQQLQSAAGFAANDNPEQKLDKLETLLAQSSEPVSTVAPLFAALLSIPVGERYPPLDLTAQRQKQKTLRTLVDQLVALATQQSLLFILEDAHWIDPTTQELIDLVVNQIQDQPVLMVITFRPEFNPPWTHHAPTTALTLNRLSRSQVIALIDKLTAGKALPDAVCEQVVAKTDGVPLFVEELVKTVLESGLLDEAVDRFVLKGTLDTLAVPSTLQDSLLARLDRLASAKSVAQLGAVIGRQFPYPLLAAVSPLTDAALDAALEQLSDAELVYRRDTSRGAFYTFKHALVQDAAYNSLLKRNRQTLHARIAQVLADHRVDRAVHQPELIAHHYTQAGLCAQAIPYWLVAGRQASERSAHIEALAHLSQGLALLHTLADTPERARQELEIQLALGPVLAATQGFEAPAVAQAYHQAQALCEQIGETSRLFPTLWGLWLSYHARAEFKAAMRVGERMLALAGQFNDPELRLQAHHALETTLYYRGEFSAAQAHIEQCLALYDADKHRSHAALYGGHDPAVCCLSFSAQALWYLGYPDQALARSREALNLAEELAHPNSLAHALDRLAWIGQLRREEKIIFQQTQRLKILATEHGFARLILMGTLMHGYALARYGNSKQGIDQMRGALTQWPELHKQPYYLALLAEASMHIGQIESGLIAVTQALALVNKTGEAQYAAELNRLQGELRLRQDVPDQQQAERCFYQAIDVARQQQAKSLELRAAASLARLWHHQGKRREAHEVLTPVYGWFTEGFDTADLKDAKALLGELT